MAVPCAPTGDKQVQLRRGTTAQNDAFTGADGEMSYDTQEKRMRIHDGVTVGGFRLGLKSEIDLKLNLTGGTLTGDLEIGAIHLDTDGSAIFGALATQISIATTGVISFPDNVRQIFNPGADNAGLNVGALAGDPSTPVNGDIWYDSTANELTARINGVNVSLGSGGSTPPFVDTTSIVMGSVDNTKLLRFEVDGFTAGATRVLTPQNNSYIIAGTNIAQTFSLLQTFDADQGINIGTMNLTDPGSAGALNIVGGDVSVVGGGLFAQSLNINLGNFAVSSAGVLTFADGVRQTFNPNGTTPGLNVGSQAGDPSTPINGDIWYDSTANELTARINGVNVALGAGGSSPPFVDTTALVMGSADNTKLLRFEVDGFTAGATRVLTPQNANYTIAGVDISNAFTVTQFFDGDGGIEIGSMVVSDPADAGTLTISNGSVSIPGGNLTVGASAEIILRSDGSADFAGSLLTIDAAGQMLFPDDVRQTFNPGATVAGLNVGSFAGDPSTPINGDIWYDSTANELTARINGVNVALGAGAGGTPGGADTQVQFNDAGAFGGDAGFSYNKTTDLITSLKLAIGATPADSLQLSNTTAAAAGAQQYSPALRFTGQGWKTTATAASQPVDCRIYLLPVQGAANPASTLSIDFAVNGGAFTNRLLLSSAGLLSGISQLNSGGIVQAGSATAFVLGSRSQIKSSADGLLELFNSAATDFTRLNFGGTTSSFPAIKRNGAGFDFRLADDSGFANIGVKNITQAVAALLSITSGTNQRAGNAVLVAGTVTVSNTTVTANTIVLLTRKTSGGTPGTLITYTLSVGTSFTINSDSALDTSTFSYFLIEVP